MDEATDAPTPVDADAALVRRVAAGDGEALRELYDRYGGLVHGLALRTLGDRQLAEDTVQDVFVALWRQAGRYDPVRGRLATWLITITRNRAIEQLRRRSSRPADPHAEVALGGQAPDPATLAGDADEAERIALAIAELPAPQLEVLRLAYFDQLTHVEIADRLGLPLGTVKGRLRLALNRLRSVAEHYELGVER